MNKKLIIIISVVALLALFIGLLLRRNSLKTSISAVSKDYSQGVLALNTDKANYIPGEKMNINMASLDKTGHTLCNSNLKLEITDPQKNTNTINVVNSTTCGDDNVTNDPDYFASQTLGKIGQYKLKLTNMDTKKVVETEIDVSESIAFDIQRAGATRINPFKSDRYLMILSVKANQDYQGKITEQIPGSFNLIWQGKATLTQKDKNKILTWEVDMKKGETQELKYEYTAPQVSPELYTIGPITTIYSVTNSTWQLVTTAQ